MRPTVFYSWQHDRPSSTNRGFIRSALDEAAELLSANVEAAVRVDQDTQGVPGSPSIPETVYRKIDEAAIFVADLTFVGSVDGVTEDGVRAKRLSNPNVLAELGHAGARLGWDRTITVMNTHYGPADDLPFDLRHRRFPATYERAPGDPDTSKVRAKLAKTLAEYIEAALSFRLVAAEDALASLDVWGVRLLLDHGDKEQWGPNVSASRNGATAIDLAVTRLLELRLATLEYSDERPYGFYTWTYRGQRVVDLLRERGARPYGRHD